MKVRVGQISIILITLVVSGCFNPPEMSDIPYIEFKKLEFFEVSDDSNLTDSLLLTFYVEDGDGDVGLTSEQSFPPYHAYNRIIDANGDLVRLAFDYVLPFYSVDDYDNITLFSEEDNRPATFNCDDYILEDGVGTYDSAIYIEQNPYHYNLHIDIMKKEDGVYESVDYASYTGNVDCSLSNFSSRIPVFDEDNIGKILKGQISYSMNSSGHKYVLARDTFKIRFFIYDQALNKSNVVDTPDLTLLDIQVD